jgi:signal transduction histidine kinase
VRLPAVGQPLIRAIGVPNVDLAVAGALALLGEADALHGGWRGTPAVNAVVVPAMALVLAWRRRTPLLALAAVMGGIMLLALAFGGSQTSTAVFITVVAVYSAAAHASTVELPVALAITAIGVAVRDYHDPEIVSFGDAIWNTILLGLTFLVGLGMRAREARTHALQAETEALKKEREIVVADAAAEERRRIARELHDIISHSLGIVVLQAGAAEQVLERDPEGARAALRSIRSTGQAAIGEMGTLLGLVRGEVHAPRQPQPSLADLDALIASMRESGLPVDLEIDGQQRTLGAALELSVFRVIQEGLTNALKHGGRVPTHVVLQFRGDELEIEVTDEGGGEADGHGTGRGLAGMRERVEVFGGRLEAGPSAGCGWTLRAVLPVAK